MRFMRLFLAACLALQSLSGWALSRGAEAPGGQTLFGLRAAPIPAVNLKFAGSRTTSRPQARLPGAPLRAALQPVRQPSGPAGSASSKPGVGERLAPLARIIQNDLPKLSRLPEEGLQGAGERHFKLLLGERPSETSDAKLPETPGPAWSARLLPSQEFYSLNIPPQRAGKPVPRPELPSDQQQQRSVRRMFMGTAAFKFGMEAISLAIPLLALQTLGGATCVGMLAVGFGLAQAVFSSVGGNLTRRFPANRVLAGAALAQAVAVGAALGLKAAGLFNPWLLFPLQGLIGASLGILEAARRVVPALILGQNDAVLRRYNSRLHVRYEMAGVAGSLAAGALIALKGPMAALILQPPACLLAAIFFWQVAHARGVPGNDAAPRRGLAEALPRYFDGLRQSARTVFGDPRLRWIALAMLLPQIAHRIIEGLLIVVFANGILHQGALSSLLSASTNTGELVGAALLLKYAGNSEAASWVRLVSLGLLGAWAMYFTTSLPFIMPLLFAAAVTWAANELSLLSELQSAVAERDQPRVLSFLFAVYMAGVTVASPVVGWFLDKVPLRTGFLGIGLVLMAVSAVLAYAARRVAANKK